MVKADIVAALCEMGYYKAQANDVVDEILNIIRGALVRGEQVHLRGFGTFGVKVRKGRNSWNVSTGEMRVSKDRKIPVFLPSDALKGAVRDGAPKSDI